MNQWENRHNRDRTITLEEMIGGVCGVLFLIGCAYFINKEVKTPIYENQSINTNTNHSDFYRRVR